MATPSINLTTSVLGFDQWQSWVFNPWATDLDSSTPVSYQTPANFAARKADVTVATTTALAGNSYANGSSGVGATLTAAGNGALTVDSFSVSAGDSILVKNEASALKNGIYTVTDPGSAGSPYILTRHTACDAMADFVGHVLVTSGTTNTGTMWLFPSLPITVGTTAVSFAQWKTYWTASTLPPGVTFNNATGALSGPATVPGVYTIGLRVSNTAGPSQTWSDSVNITIGIDPKAVAVRTGVDLYIDVRTGQVSTSLSGGLVSPLLSVKANDDILIYVHFVRDGTTIDLGTLSELSFALKEFEPEVTLVLGGGTTAGTDFARDGSGTNAVYIMCVSFGEQALKSELSNYEEDSGTFFIGVAEIKWVETNESGIGPGTLRRRTTTFGVRVERNVAA